MNQVEIRYRPIAFIPWMRKIKRTHPEAWHELTPAQFIVVACAFKETITDRRLVSSMLNISRRLVRKMPAYYIQKLIELLEFVQTVTPYNEFVIKSICNFNCPKPRLKDETFGTFIFAETYFSRYIERSDTLDLNRFIACWFRDNIFDDTEIESRAAEIGREPLVKREAILINYQLIREYLVITYPNVFEKHSITKNEVEKHTWVDVFDSIVGDDLKDQDKYANLPLSAVLRYLDKRLKNMEHESPI